MKRHHTAAPKNTGRAQAIVSTKTQQQLVLPLKRISASAQANLSLGASSSQIWEGFGGCFNELGWAALSLLKATERDSVLQSLFDSSGLGLNVGRIPIGASDYALGWYSHNEHEGDLAMAHFSIERDRRHLLPYIKAAQKWAPHLKFFASPWSPPTWMKSPAVYNYGRLRTEPPILNAYARYFLKFVQSYTAEGVPIHQLHPQNEPAADQKFPSCLWSGEELKIFVRDHLGPLLRREAPEVELWLGTINSADYSGMILPSLADAKTRQYLSGVGLQWDGKQAIQRIHESFPSLRLMQTENECGDGTNSWDYAHYVFSLVQHYLSNGATAYVYWNLILEPGGASSWGWRQNSLVTINPQTRSAQYNPEYTILAHLAPHIRPGCVRHRLEGAWAGNAVGFVSPQGRVTIALHNPLNEGHPIIVRHAGETYRIEAPARSFVTLCL